MQIIRSLKILMYHSIADNPLDPHAIRPEAFDQQMRQLEQSGATIVSVSDGIRRLWGGVIGGGMVAVSFDDALRDFLVTAAPILLSHHIPASVFVPTAFVGKTAEWDTHDKSKPLMDWDQLNEIQRLGFDVGSHSVTHPRLVNCDDRQLEYELRHSLEELQDRLTQPPLPILAFPGGFTGERELAMVRKTDYIAGLGVTSRWLNYRWTNPLHLRRQKWGTRLFQF